MTDELILQGCVQHEPAAQKALYERFSAKMMAICYRYAGNKQDAEDMLQESMVRIFAHIHQFQQKGSFEGWIRRVIVHTCINYLKRQKKFHDCMDLTHAEHYVTRENHIPSIIQAKEITECIRSLPVGYRTILNLYALEGYSHREIAGMLEIQESTSRSQYNRAKNLLKQLLFRRNIVFQTGLKNTWSKLKKATSEF
jgi:RNA polymerase sigma-70 factor (ECF subfamily)